MVKLLQQQRVGGSCSAGMSMASQCQNLELHPQADKSLLSMQVPNQSRQISATALALLPLLAEAVALGLCLGLWLKLDVFMAVAGALILSAVCPALVGVITQQWQCSRLGTRKGTGTQTA